MDSDGLAFFHSVIWDKVNPGLGWRYRRQHEMVMVSHRVGGKLLWNSDRKAVSNIYSLMPPRQRSHPNEKPLEMVSHFIENHSLPGQVILDPFMGGGTTGVSAVQSGRKFIGVELDADHFETALRRVSDALNRPRLFIPAPAPKAKQESLL